MKRLTLILSCVLTLSACAPLKTKKPGDDIPVLGRPYGGVPYHLPDTRIVVELSAVKDDNQNIRDLSISATPKQVPDPDTVYYLVQSRNLLHSSNHTITVRNGLLQTISTTDEGKTGAVIQSLLNSVINLYKAQSGFVQAPTTAQSTGSEDPFLNTSEFPSPAEVLKAFNMFQGDTFAFTTKTQGETTSRDVPGTNQLLSVESQTNREQSSKSTKWSCNRLCWLRRNDSGVRVRSLIPAETVTRINMDLDELQKLRVAAQSKAIAVQQKKVTSAENTLGRQKRAKTQACATVEADKKLLVALAKEKADLSASKPSANGDQLEGIKSRITDVEEGIATVKARQNNCTTATTALAGAEGQLSAARAQLKKLNEDLSTVRAYSYANPYLVYRNQDIHLVVDDKHEYRVPMRRAPIGKTTYSLTFADGILTDHASTHPSTVAEVVSVIETVTSSVADFVAEIIPLKIHTATKQIELLTKQAELEEKIKEVSSTVDQNKALQGQIDALQAKDDLTPTEAAQLEVLELKMEKNLQTLRAKIATLENEIQTLRAAGSGGQPSSDGDKPPGQGEEGMDQPAGA